MQLEKLQLTIANQKHRILLIEDNLINVRIVESMLDRAGYNVDYAVNGLEGIEMVRELKPDLILLDVVMPDLTGFEVCKKLKNNPETAHIPIIFITSESETNSIVRGFEVGAVDYITKPLHFREMIARVQTHITLKELRAGLENEITQKESLISDLNAFTHMVAHDLKNPVSSILGFSEILLSQRQVLSEESLVTTFTHIKNSGDKIHQIIDSLLLLANVRLKEVEYIETDIYLLIMEVKSRLHAQIEQSGFKLTTQQKWPKVIGYPPWIEEVLANFISNAIKYGGAPPTAKISFAYSDNHSLKIMVKDNGDGLLTGQESMLYQPFSRLHSSGNGHGLGLSITKRIVEKMNGVVGVENTVGEGATFFFTIPLAEFPLAE